MMKIYIRTFGCQMNVRDSEGLSGMFLDKGYSLTENPKQADVVLVNTCSVREHAEDRAISLLGSFKKLKRKAAGTGKGPVIGLIGCMSVNRGRELAGKMPHIDLVCGPANLSRIVEYVDRIRKEKCRIIDVEDKARDEELYKPLFRIGPDKAQVVISTGCSNFCSYCIVPYMRGPLRLRQPQDIIAEVRRNLDIGRTKIVLLGQNVNDYRYFEKSKIKDKISKIEDTGAVKSNIKSQKSKMEDTGREKSKIKYQISEIEGREIGQLTEDREQLTVNRRQLTGHGEQKREIGFAQLLRMVAEIHEVEEVDFITSNPRNVSEELFDVMAESKKIRKHLHLPLQSGSNRILKLMNRGYDQGGYLSIVEKYKQKVGGTLGTDIIVGFPGETREDFLETRRVMEKVRFKYAYIFKYSSRPRTRAADMEDDVSEEEKAFRHQQLLTMQKEINR